MEQKNIDRLFQEKLKDFEREPSNHIWNNIDNALHKKKKRRILPFWIPLTGIAAALLLWFTLNNSFLGNPANENNTTTDINEVDPIKNQKDKESINNDIPVLELNNLDSTNAIAEKEKDSDEKIEEKINNVVAVKKSIANINSSQNSKDQSTSISKQKATQNSTENLAFISNKQLTNEKEQKSTRDLSKDKLPKFNEKTNTVEKNKNEHKNLEKNADVHNKKNGIDDLNKGKLPKFNDKTTTVQTDKVENTNTEKKDAKPEKEKGEGLKDINDVLKDKELIVEEDPFTENWSIASVVAPVYFNPFETTGSLIDAEFQDNTKTTQTNLSYGLKVNYAFNKRLSVQSGVNVLKLSYSNPNVNVSSSLVSSKFKNINYSPAGAALTITSENTQPAAVAQSAVNDVNSVNASTKGVLEQQFGYIEIPTEIKYKVSNGKKLGVSVVGGFSTLILNENTISLETSDFSQNIGSANNLNTINFSGNLGLDVDYKISKNLSFNVSPMIKSQSNIFSSTGNLKPYFLGIYSGLNYKF